MRIVLYAEGAGELAGTVTQLPRPGNPLKDEMVGAAHALVRRVLCDSGGLKPDAVRFDSPLRDPRTGRSPKGSDLLSPALLKRVTAWPRPLLTPDLVVVLVDQDGERQRRNRVQASLSQLKVPAVLGVAVQEFEAWLVADADRVEQLLGCEPPLDRSLLSSPESLEPRGSKRALQQWIARSNRADEEERVTRRRIAEALDLEVLKSSCRAFGQFASELGRIR